MKILIINGPNLNLLGARDSNSYGNLTLTELETEIINEFPNDDFVFFQSNVEGEIISQLQNPDGFAGLIINPGGYAHTSVAIRDALEIVQIPKIEVHLSNLAMRDEFRHTMLTAAKTDGYVSGFKELSYFSAVYLMHKIIEN